MNPAGLAMFNYAGTCANLIRTDRWNLIDIERSLEKINQQALRAGALLARLRSFVSKTAPQPAPLDINQLILSVLQLMKTDTHARGVGVDTALSQDLPAVNGDAVQLQQVVVNLIRNVSEAMETTPSPARRLTIRSQRVDQQTVCVSLADNGPGIPPSQRESIFDPYEGNP